MCLESFALWTAFPSSDYYHSAAPTLHRVAYVRHWQSTCLPTEVGVCVGSGVTHVTMYPLTLGALQKPLFLANQAGKRLQLMYSRLDALMPYGIFRHQGGRKYYPFLTQASTTP